MIDLKGSRFTSIMPENLASQVEIQAIAYAVGRQIEKLCDYVDGGRIYAVIEAAPERVLDLLAVELRTPAYDENFSLSVKRALVADTLLFYTQMGTPAACERLIQIIFKTGYIEEWFDYGGEPHHFRAFVGQDGGPVDPGNLEEFRRVIGSVKRLSSWMDEVITISSFEAAAVKFLGRMGRGYMQTVMPEAPVDYHMDETVLWACGGFRTITVTNLPPAAGF